MLLFDVNAAAIDNNLRHLRGGAVVEVDQRLTIHLLMEYRKVGANALDIPGAFNRRGYDCVDCCNYSFTHDGQPIIFAEAELTSMRPCRYYSPKHRLETARNNLKLRPRRERHTCVRTQPLQKPDRAWACRLELHVEEQAAK